MLHHLPVHVGVMALSSMFSSAMACDVITDKDVTKLESYVRTWYKIPSNQTVTLVGDSTVDAFCYRKLVFRSSAPAPLLTLYLTPDGKHLVTGVMDLTVDPVVAQRKMRQELADKLSSGANLIKGPETAPLKIVVFSDFQCPYCKQFADIVQQLTPEERSKLQIVYRQLPLNIHPWARDAAALSTVRSTKRNPSGITVCLAGALRRRCFLGIEGGYKNAVYSGNGHSLLCSFVGVRLRKASDNERNAARWAADCVLARLNSASLASTNTGYPHIFEQYRGPYSVRPRTRQKRGNSRFCHTA